MSWTKWVQQQQEAKPGQPPPPAARELDVEAERPDWFTTACKMGNAFYNLAQANGIPDDWKSAARALVQEWDANCSTARRASHPAPVSAGTLPNLADGYEGGKVTPDTEDLGGTVTLHYTSPAEAENAFAAIESHIKAGKGPQA